MRILVAWHDPAEAELLSLYLNLDESSAEITSDLDDFWAKLGSGTPWDIVLLPTDRPDDSTAMSVFQQVRKTRPDLPIVGACHMETMFQLAGFLGQGLRAYVVRDQAGDFMFLLQATLQGVVEAVKAERERIISAKLREEIESVRKLQESIMPRDLRSPDGYRICGRYESSQLQVIGGTPVVLAGGDYYDVFEAPNNETIVLLGDAAGHGMKACISIMAMHTLIRMILDRRYKDTAAFVESVNRHLCEQTMVGESEGFITMLFGLLKSQTNEFQWTSAGHPLPLLHRLDENTVEPMGTMDDGGMPLGIISECDYEWKSIEVPPRSRIILYTDGLEEAFPAEKQDTHGQFGQAGIMRTVKECRDKPLDETLDVLFNASNAFTEGAGRHDDTSVLLIERGDA
ncbi:PP2C family protein-serine/threonine phosphatase [Thalassoroseus pseudoceratinae]|uniref:PP2C family protein-serine/threonine phosphatase n=1 Tax=Thalassoroseus pseudoceratinae TaxID=2713176 RepID=UPI0014207E6D|nr:PP2C family protein-serine/threonine phosphatase [Thalassoroseus pseudoceratinae]